eukprot:879685-Rhodomonas_salina.3
MNGWFAAMNRPQGCRNGCGAPTDSLHARIKAGFAPMNSTNVGIIGYVAPANRPFLLTLLWHVAHKWHATQRKRRGTAAIKGGRPAVRFPSVANAAAKRGYAAGFGSLGVLCARSVPDTAYPGRRGSRTWCGSQRHIRRRRAHSSQIREAVPPPYAQTSSRLLLLRLVSPRSVPPHFR